MATLTWLLDVTAPDAKKTFDAIKLRMDQLDANLKKTREVTVGDRSAMATFARLQLQADRFGDRISNMPLTIEGAAKAEATLLGLEATADRLNTKLGVRQRNFSVASIGKSLISFGAFKGLATGGQATALTPAWLDVLASPGGLAAAGTAGTAGLPVIASLIDALTGFGIGAGVAGAGFKGVQSFNPAVLAPGLTNIKKTFSSVFQSIGPSVGMMLADFGRQVQGMAPMLAKLFSASLPFMRAFFIVLEQAAKNILPAFTQAMNVMVRTGALKAMLQGFVALTQGTGRFINALGPGMKAGAEVFRAVSIGISGTLDALGKTLGWLGKYAQTEFHLIATHFDAFRHDVAAIYGGIYHETVSIWDMIWRNTVSRVANGITAVEKWFHGLPSSVQNALRGLGKMLLGIATGSMNSFLSGLKSVGGSILSWIKNFFAGIPHAILSLLHMSPPHPGSVFFDLGANMMRHFEAGIQSRARNVLGSIGSAVGAAIGRGSGATAGGIQGLAYQLAKARGWASQWGAIQAVEMAEAGWNMRARNPSSGAYGIAQFINGPAEYYTWGGNPYTAIGQITAFYNYIASRYGAILGPSAAAAHEARFHWYGTGLRGGIFDRPTLIGVGERGPERVDVTPVGRGRRSGQIFGDVHIHNEVDAAIVTQRLSFAVTAAGLGS